LPPPSPPPPSPPPPPSTPPELRALRAASWARLWPQHDVLLAAVAAVNGAWLLLLVVSACLRDEGAYGVWRQAHAHRLTKTWWARTWMQMKTQHRLLRVLWLRFNVAQDPAALHTGAQKATILAAIVLLKMLLATLFFPAGDFGGVCAYDCQFGNGELISGVYTDRQCEGLGGTPRRDSGKGAGALAIDLAYKSLVCALCAVPVALLLDGAFGRAQKLGSDHVAKQGLANPECARMVSAAVRYLPGSFRT
jgi:hypothetical protein